MQRGRMHSRDRKRLRRWKSCTADSCDPGTGCLNTPQESACEDGNTCTEDDTCVAGQCESGTNVCGCQNIVDCLPLEDGNLCNGTLVCDQSSFPFTCVVDPETVIVCDDSADTTCMTNQCNSSNGTCSMVASPDTLACEDGDLCTQGDSCLNGECNPSGLVECDDGNVCTDDACAGGECVYAPNTASCDDGNACTTGDVCGSETCSGVPVSCARTGIPVLPKPAIPVLDARLRR